MRIIRSGSLAVSVAVACVAIALAGRGSGAVEHARRSPVAQPAAREGGQAIVTCPIEVRGLGSIAFVAGGRLELVNLRSCRLSGLARGAFGPVRFSADGRWLAFSRAAAGDPGGPAVVAVHGGAVTRPLGGGILAWSWAPTGALLYGVNTRGQLLSAAPGGRSRIISTGSAMSNAWAPAVAPSPSGRLIAVDRSRCSGTPETELDTTDPLSGIGQAALTHAVGQVTFAGWSPDGRWLLYWAAAMCSSSLAADGWPLRAVPVSGGRSVPAVAHMLLFPDFLTWCGHQLIAASGPTRETQLASSLVATAPPSWRQRTIARASRLSWVSPSCAPSGDVLAAAAGANSENPGFGFAHRSIWLLAPDGRILRRIASPSSLQLSDEAPRFSRDGRWILFVESRVVPVGDSAISRDTIELVPAAAGGDAPAIPIVHFSSDDFSYYDHFSWPSEIDWH